MAVNRKPRFQLKLQIVYDDGSSFMSGPVVDMSETGVFIERRPIIGVAAVEEPPGDGAGYMDDLDTIRRCSSGSQWEYLAGIGKFMAIESPPTR